MYSGEAKAGFFEVSFKLRSQGNQEMGEENVPGRAKSMCQTARCEIKLGAFERLKEIYDGADCEVNSCESHSSPRRQVIIHFILELWKMRQKG